MMDRLSETPVEEEVHMPATDVKPGGPAFYRLCKTAVLFLAWICIGLWSSTVTPCIDIFKDQVHSDYEQISRAMAAKSAGIIFGSVIGGYLADKFQRQIDLLLGLEVLLAGVAIAALPWTPSLLLMTVAFGLNGLCQGGLSAGGNAHAIGLWGAKATGPVHFIHFGYGIGTVLGPAIMAAFLPNSPNKPHDANLTDFSAVVPAYHYASHNYRKDMFYMNTFDVDVTDTNGNFGNSSMDRNATSADIKIPFAIAGSFTVCVALILLVFLCFPYHKFLSGDYAPSHSERPKKTLKEIISPGECAAGNTVYGLQMFILIFLFYVALVGKDIGVTIFIEPIARNSPHLEFSLEQADLLVTAYFICYASGRLLIAGVGTCIPIQIIIFIESVMNVVAIALLIIFGLHSNLGFWLTNMMFAVFTGPMFPSGMAWIDRYIKMTGLAFSVLDIGIGLGSFTFTWVCGYLLKSHPHSHVYLYYLSLVCCSVELVVLIIMQIRGSIAGDRYKTNMEEPELDHDAEEDAVNYVDDISPLVQ